MSVTLFLKGLSGNNLADPGDSDMIEKTALFGFFEFDHKTIMRFPTFACSVSFIFIALLTSNIYTFDSKGGETPARGMRTDSVNCPHVRILTPGLSAQVEEQFRSKVVNPETNQRKALAMALDALPPFVCKAVRRVVFVNAVLPEAGEAVAWVGRSRPDLINISAVPGGASEERLTVDLSDIPSMDPGQNETRKQTLVRVWPEVIHSIIHEAYHCAVSLLETATEESSGPTDVWPANLKADAKSAIEKTKLTGGFVVEWTRINEEFTDLGFGTGYDESRTGRLIEPPVGFMTNYAGNKPGEDIAETASWISARQLLNASYGGVTADLSDWKYGCRKLESDNRKGIPANIAALYTKMRLLEDLGLITTENFDKCVGNGNIGLKEPSVAMGFQFFDYESWAPYTAFGTDAKMIRNPSMLAISAWGRLTSDGKLRRSVIELQFNVEENEYPRGVYKIKSCNLYKPLGFYPLSSPVQFKRRVEDTGNQTICAYDALVLVTTARAGRFRGSIILYKVWKFSAPPVPEVAGFPVHVIFKFG